MLAHHSRNASCRRPCNDGDDITARVLLVRGDQTVFIISLDLVGVSSTFAKRLQSAVCQAVETTASVLIAATHTHGSPQTHDAMVGFGHAPASYMDAIVRAVVEAAREAMKALRPASIRHVRTAPLGLSVNRRQRVDAEREAFAPVSKRPRGSGVMWFEKAGRTALGQRADGPRQPIADVIDILASDGTSIATVLCWACHPVCCGKAATAQTADFVNRARRVVEAHTGAPTLYLNGACGDVNPLERGGGFEAAERLGDALGRACVAALRCGTDARAAASEGTFSCAAVEGVARLPLEPLPSEAEAAAFVDEQKAWLESARGTEGDPWPSSLPQATLAYAHTVLAASRAGAGSPHVECPLHAVRIGPVVLLAAAAELFSAFASHLASASPHASTITVGYTNGCIGYLPTEAEVPHGGYEVVHAHVPYGQPQRLHKEAERELVTAALELLSALPAAEPTLEPTPLERRAARGRRWGLPAMAIDSRFEHAHDTYNSIGVTAGGAVLYVLSSAEPLIGGRLYRFADGDAAPTLIADLTAACGDPPGCIAQGKAHCPLLEDSSDGSVYFGTHVGWYVEVDGMEVHPAAGVPGLPHGVAPYPGGCLLRLAPDGVSVTRLARLPGGEGIITFAADFERKRLCECSRYQTRSAAGLPP